MNRIFNKLKIAGLILIILSGQIKSFALTSNKSDFYLKVTNALRNLIETSYVQTPLNGKLDTIYGFKTDKAPSIDGKGDEDCWKKGEWTLMDQRWLGPEFTKEDFNGRFKIAWTADRLYLLAEITDDVLNDHYPDPLDSHYKDDCLELFLDENHSGGDHTYNFNAFAYHVSTLYDVVDLGTDNQTHLFNDHINAKWTNNGNLYTWELEIKVFPDTYKLDSEENKPVQLTEGKILGLSLAYCDNDGGNDRENFIGSQVITGNDKNTSWINASAFGTLKLIGSNLTGITNNKQLEDLKIYPNPVKNNFNINLLNNQLGVVEIKIVSIDGKLLKVFKSQKTSNLFNENFFLKGINSGIYNVEVFINENRNTIKTIIIK